MQNLIGQWGGADLSGILNSQNKEYIHPDDWSVLENYPYMHTKHQCIGMDGKYAILKFGDEKIRVLADLFQVAKEPTFKPIEKVKYLSSKGIWEFGIIVGIHWHAGRQEYYYTLKDDLEKLKTRRYFNEDLVKIEA